MQTWAKLYRMYFVSALDCPCSSVVNPLGQVVIRPWDHGPILCASLNLDYVVIHCDYNAKKFPAIKSAYGALVDIEYIAIESAATVVSRHPERTAEQIVAEFSLEREEDYYKRSAEIRRSKLLL